MHVFDRAFHFIHVSLKRSNALIVMTAFRMWVTHGKVYPIVCAHVSSRVTRCSNEGGRAARSARSFALRVSASLISSGVSSITVRSLVCTLTSIRVMRASHLAY